MFGRQRKSQCQRIQEVLSPYLDNRLTSVERDAVKYHVEICEDCRRELDSLEITAQLLQRMPVATAPRSFTLAEAPKGRVWVPLGIPVTSWLQGMAIAAIILLAVMLAGDFSGLFYTDISPKALEVAETTIPTEAAILPEKEAVASEVATPMLREETTTEEVINIPEAKQEAEPPVAPSEDRGIAQKATGPGEVIPPTGSAAEEPDISRKASPLPGTAEATPLISPSVAESELPLKEASPWLRPLEIIFAALVIILGGINLLIRQRKRGFVSIKRS